MKINNNKFLRLEMYFVIDNFFFMGDFLIVIGFFKVEYYGIILVDRSFIVVYDRVIFLLFLVVFLMLLIYID